MHCARNSHRLGTPSPVHVCTGVRTARKPPRAACWNRSAMTATVRARVTIVLLGLKSTFTEVFESPTCDAPLACREEGVPDTVFMDPLDRAPRSSHLP